MKQPEGVCEMVPCASDRSSHILWWHMVILKNFRDGEKYLSFYTCKAGDG